MYERRILFGLGWVFDEPSGRFELPKEMVADIRSPIADMIQLQR